MHAKAFTSTITVLTLNSVCVYVCIISVSVMVVYCTLCYANYAAKLCVERHMHTFNPPTLHLLVLPLLSLLISHPLPPLSSHPQIHMQVESGAPGDMYDVVTNEPRHKPRGKTSDPSSKPRKQPGEEGSLL